MPGSGSTSPPSSQMPVPTPMALLPSMQHTQKNKKLQCKKCVNAKAKKKKIKNKNKKYKI